MYNATADINIIPLMDLVFNLLIVFMLTTPLLEQSINLKLPTTSSATSMDNKQVATVNLDSTGRLMMNKTPISLADVEKWAKNEVRSNPDQAVLVRGDERVPYGKFVEVVDRLKKAGVTKIGIVGLAPH
jgi:biopolymer transport protein ExbD